MAETLNSQFSILNFFRVPGECYLGKRVFKKLFHENAKLGATDKKAFREDIDTLIWQYTLKPSTIPIQAYEDKHREYLEVAVLQVNLKTQRRTSRIAEIVHRAIPYPLVIVFCYCGSKIEDCGLKNTKQQSSILNHKFAISLAHKRFSQAEKGAVVVEDLHLTDWIDLSAPTSVQKDFLASLAMSALPHTHFFAFYSALVDRLVALDCARLTGEYRLERAAAKRTARSNRLAACHELETRIAEYKAAIKKETQFNRQVELNTKISEINEQLSELVREL